MKQRKISVTIITLNEEAEIGACLDSVTWADEIVVVDSGSSDRTVEIAGKYTDKVFKHEWPGYAAQKNWAVNQASHDWILSLDADERVSPELQGEIKGVMAGGSPFSGYYVPRKNFFLGRWIRRAGWYPDYTIRLFDRREGRFGDRMVHESVVLSGAAGRLKGPIEHYTYRSLADYHERAGRYAALAASEMRRAGRTFRPADLVARPIWTFCKMYFFQQGFREGIYGLLLSMFYGYYAFLKYAKLWELERDTRSKNGV